jgi:phosphatidylinositol-3-phosphatase
LKSPLIRALTIAPLLVASACAGRAGSPVSAPSKSVSTAPAVAPLSFSHVVVVVMENKEYGQVIGNPQAPYINALAARYGLATNYHAMAHPSLPNYLALIGGSTFGITSDCTDCAIDGTNLVDQLETAGISWKAYMEGLPSPCFLGPSAGDYAKKHDPFLYFTDVANDPARCSKVVPLTELSSDISGGTLPRFAWITPNLCHDMHDCGVSVGDRFLSQLLPPILSALGPDGLLFLTWDEGTSDLGAPSVKGGGHVATIVAGPHVQPGRQLAAEFGHYSILATIEGIWGLPLLRQAGCTCTRPMTALFAPI